MVRGSGAFVASRQAYLEQFSSETSLNIDLGRSSASRIWRPEIHQEDDTSLAEATEPEASSRRQYLLELNVWVAGPFEEVRTRGSHCLETSPTPELPAVGMKP